MDINQQESLKNIENIEKDKPPTEYNDSSTYIKYRTTAKFSKVPTKDNSSLLELKLDKGDVLYTFVSKEKYASLDETGTIAISYSYIVNNEYKYMFNVEVI